MCIPCNTLRVGFTGTGGGLVTRDGAPPTCFEIAAAEGNFASATAELVGEEVVVSSSAVKSPVAVRFSWGAADVSNLMGKSGLPASQFRAKDSSQR